MRLKRPPITVVILAIVVSFVSTNVFAQSEANTYYEQALEKYQQQDLPTTYIHLKNVLQLNADHIPAKILMGKVLLQKGYFIDAALILEEALALGGDIEFIIAPLAESLLYQKKYQQVLSLAKKRVLTPTTKFQWLMLSARAYHKLQQTEQELVSYQRAYKISNTPSAKASALNGIAAVNLTKNNFTKVSALLAKSAKYDADNYTTWYLQGQLAIQQGNYDKALSSLEHAYELNNHYIDTKRALAKVYLQQQNDQQALSLIDQVLTNAPFDTRATLLKANLLLSSNQDETAKRILNQLNQQIGLIPEDVLLDNNWLLFINGISAYLLKNYESALRELIKYQKMNPGNLQAIAMIADAYLKIDQPSYARNILDQYRKILPKNLELSLLLCDLYLQENKLLACQSLLAEITHLHPSTAKTVLIQAKIYAHKKQLKQAILLLESKVNTYPTNDMLTYLISLYMQAAQYQQAATLIDSLLQQYPNNLPLINAMAAALLKLNKPKQAYNIAQLVLSVNAEHYGAQFNQASALLNLRKPQPAKEILLTLTAKQPQHIATLLLLAKVEIAIGDASTAIEVLKKVLFIKEDQVAANEMLVALFKLTGQYEQALERLNTLLRYDRLSSSYIHSKAEIYIALGDSKQARKQFNILAELWHDNAEKLLRLARTQRQADDLLGARASLDRALELAPTLQAVVYEDAKLSLYQQAYDNTEQKIASLMKTNKNSSKVVMLAGDLWLSKQKPKQAQLSYLSAFSFNPNNGMAIAKAYNLAIIGILPTKFEQALTQVFAHKKINKRHLFWYRNLLADYLLLAKRYPEAKYQYLLIKDTEDLPNKAEVLNNLAYATMHEDLTAAAEYAQQASVIKPNSATILDTYGWILAKQQQFTQALGILRQANALDARKPSLLFHLGYTLDKLGKKEEATSVLNLALASALPFDEKPNAKSLLDDLLTH